MLCSRQIYYTVYSSTTCNIRQDSLEMSEVLEFSVRLLSNPSEWIPLSIIHTIEQTTSNCRRGYCVQDIATLHPRNMPNIMRKIQICGIPLNDSIQLRWLMSSLLGKNRRFGDWWSLDDIEINLITGNFSKSLIRDNFNNSALK